MRLEGKRGGTPAAGDTWGDIAELVSRLGKGRDTIASLARARDGRKSSANCMLFGYRYLHATMSSNRSTKFGSCMPSGWLIL